MLSLKIPNMDCGGCAKAVTNIIKSVAPDVTVEIDVPGKNVQVSGAVDAQVINDALKEGGYPAAA